MSSPHRVHAFSDDALGDLDAVGLVEALRRSEVSVPEVVDAAIARSQKVHAQIGGVAQPAFDWARAYATDPRPGWFSGVPIFVKDNVDVQGLPTFSGTDAWVGKRVSGDGDLARLLAAVGLLGLGKSRLSELGFSPAVEHPRLGPVRCPWDPTRTAGASSAGAAVLVATGAVPIAHGNDGGGSIRIPASVNGLVGLKPSRGRLPQDAALRRMPVRIVADGVLTRTVRDTAAFYREAEKVWRDPGLPPVGDVARPGRARLRIAVDTDGVERGATAEVGELTLSTARLLEEQGHHVELVRPPLPASFPADFLLYWSFLAWALLRGGRREHGASFDPDRLDGLTHGLADHARRHLHLLPGAIVRLRRTTTAARRFHETYDVVLTPTLASPTPSLGHLDPAQPYDVVLDRILDWVAFTPWHNASGAPAISLPLATTTDGLPLGMMFGAAHGREALLLGLALELEETMPFRRLDDDHQADHQADQRAD